MWFKLVMVLSTFSVVLHDIAIENWSCKHSLMIHICVKLFYLRKLRLISVWLRSCFDFKW